MARSDFMAKTPEVDDYSGDQAASFPIRSGFHPFVDMEHAVLEVDRSEITANEESLLIYTFGTKPAVKYRKINAINLVERKMLTAGKLLLSIMYTLNSTRDAEKVFNCRQIFQIDDEVFVFIEYKFKKPYDVVIDQNLQKVKSLEGVLICNNIYEILDDFLIWLVEVDPIGFELLRRMNRDGFIDFLEVDEEIWPMHDSDNLMDRWLNRMVDYADTIELRLEIDVEHRSFLSALKSAASTANSFTSLDMFQRSEREQWVHLRHREEDIADEDEDEDEEIPDLTDAEIDQLRKEAIARQNATKEYLFVDLPPALKTLILDLMDRIEKKIGEEEASNTNHDLMRFTEGSTQYNEAQISSQMAKLLRLLT
jgi:hypothetical protein